MYNLKGRNNIVQRNLLHLVSLYYTSVYPHFTNTTNHDRRRVLGGAIIIIIIVDVVAAVIVIASVIIAGK